MHPSGKSGSKASKGVASDGHENAGASKRRSMGSASLGPDEDVFLMKRHRTRAALSKRQLTADTVLHFVHPKADANGVIVCEDGSDDSDDSAIGDDADHSAAALASAASLPLHASTGGKELEIVIPHIRELSLEELQMSAPPLGEGEEEENITDEWYRAQHVVFEIKEQALREQAMRSGGVRKIMRRAGPVTATELMFAPTVESKLKREDHLEVLGKTDLPDVPEERLRDIESKLEEVEKSYQPEQKFVRYYLHTAWAPIEIKREVVDASPTCGAGVEGSTENGPGDASSSGAAAGGDSASKKPKLVLKLKRLK